MTDPATLLADQAEEIADSDTINVLRMAQILALWGDALLAVLDYCSEVEDATPTAARELRSRITTALEAK